MSICPMTLNICWLACCYGYWAIAQLLDRHLKFPQVVISVL